jgi:hypothetical protein
MDGIGRANKVIQSVHGLFGLDRDRASILLGEFGVGYSFLRGCKHLDTVNRAVRRSFRNESNLIHLRQHKSMIKNGKLDGNGNVRYIRLSGSLPALNLVSLRLHSVHTCPMLKRCPQVRPVYPYK